MEETVEPMIRDQKCQADIIACRRWLQTTGGLNLESQSLGLMLNTRWKQPFPPLSVSENNTTTAVITVESMVQYLNACKGIQYEKVHVNTKQN